jgi:hypothetical protein
MKALEALRRFTDLLNREEIPYMVVGSFSSNFHGIPRSTKDADIVLEFDTETWAALSEKLPDGLTLEAQGLFEMDTATRKEVVLVEGSVFEIEVFRLSEDPFDQERFSRREKVELSEGQHAWVATAEDVIVQKLRWAKGGLRSKDLDDVVSVLLRKRELIDFDYVNYWCGLHETRPLFEKALAEAGGR